MKASTRLPCHQYVCRQWKQLASFFFFKLISQSNRVRYPQFFSKIRINKLVKIIPLRKSIRLLMKKLVFIRIFNCLQLFFFGDTEIKCILFKCTYLKRRSCIDLVLLTLTIDNILFDSICYKMVTDVFHFIIFEFVWTNSE